MYVTSYTRICLYDLYSLQFTLYSLYSLCSLYSPYSLNSLYYSLYSLYSPYSLYNLYYSLHSLHNLYYSLYSLYVVCPWVFRYMVLSLASGGRAFGSTVGRADSFAVVRQRCVCRHGLADWAGIGRDKRPWCSNALRASSHAPRQVLARGGDALLGLRIRTTSGACRYYICM